MFFLLKLWKKKKLHMKHKCFGTWSRWFNVVLLLITIFVYQFTTGNFRERKKRKEKIQRNRLLVTIGAVEHIQQSRELNK